MREVSRANRAMNLPGLASLHPQATAGVMFIGRIMIRKRLKDITCDDLDELVANQVKESRTLEYKEAFPGKGDSESIPFLAEVSAFANTMGG
jgi:hypothetical protein